MPKYWALFMLNCKPRQNVNHLYASSYKISQDDEENSGSDLDSTTQNTEPISGTLLAAHHDSF